MFTLPFLEDWFTRYDVKIVILYFIFFRSMMDSLYPLFYENLQDCIPSVRQGAAQALANVVRAYGKYQMHPLTLSVVMTNFHNFPFSQ